MAYNRRKKKNKITVTEVSSVNLSSHITDAEVEFISSANAPKKIDTSFIRFLVKDGSFIKNGDYFLVVSENQENTLQYIATEMMRIGDYKTNNKQYNKQQQYITYGKNN